MIQMYKLHFTFYITFFYRDTTRLLFFAFVCKSSLSSKSLPGNTELLILSSLSFLLLSPKLLSDAEEDEKPVLRKN